MSVMFVINILLIFMISISLTTITMEFFKPSFWVWHFVTPVYFLIICTIFFWGE